MNKEAEVPHYQNKIKYNFCAVDSSYAPYIAGSWIGQYTTGYVNCRGTRLWLKTHGALSLDSGLNSDGAVMRK